MASPPVTRDRGEGEGLCRDTGAHDAAAEQDPLANRVRYAALTAHGEGSGHPVSQGHMVHGLQTRAELRSSKLPHLLEGASKQLINPFHFCFLTSKFGHQSLKVNFPKGHRHTVESVHVSQPRVSVRLVQTSAVMFRPLWEAHVSHLRLVAVHSLWAWLGSLYVPFFSSHSWRREICDRRQFDPGFHKPLWPKSL